MNEEDVSYLIKLGTLLDGNKCIIALTLSFVQVLQLKDAKLMRAGCRRERGNRP